MVFENPHFKKWLKPIDEVDRWYEKNNLFKFGFQLSSLHQYLRGIHRETRRSPMVDMNVVLKALGSLCDLSNMVDLLKSRVTSDIIKWIGRIEKHIQSGGKNKTHEVTTLITKIEIWKDRIENTPKEMDSLMVEMALFMDIVGIEDIGSNMNEAISDYDNQAYRSCVVMCRRALQLSAMKKGAKNLSDGWDRLPVQLKWLKKEGIITKKIYQMAIACKEIGNYGAHPNDDGLNDIGMFEGEWALKITMKLIEEMFTEDLKIGKIGKKKNND